MTKGKKVIYEIGQVLNEKSGLRYLGEALPDYHRCCHTQCNRCGEAFEVGIYLAKVGKRVSCGRCCRKSSTKGRILLSNDLFFYIDIEDQEYLERFTWHLAGKILKPCGVVQGRKQYSHRLLAVRAGLMDKVKGKNRVGFKDGNPLNQVRDNLTVSIAKTPS